MIYALLVLWLTWCLAHLALMALVTPSTPCYTGFRVVMPAYLRDCLTVDEYCAVLAHELGHRKYMHPWKNLARRCVFLTASAQERLWQEREADDYASENGMGLALAKALRKLSRSPVDWERAARLEGLNWAAHLAASHSEENCCKL